MAGPAAAKPATRSMKGRYRRQPRRLVGGMKINVGDFMEAPTGSGHSSTSTARKKQNLTPLFQRPYSWRLSRTENPLGWSSFLR